MKTIYRYLLAEIAPPTGVGLLVILFLLSVTQILRAGDLLFGKALGLTDELLFIGLLVPSFLILAAPIALLFGGLAGMGRLSADRELVAFRAAGVSPLRLLPVPVALGVACSLLCLVMTLWAEPLAMRTLKRAALDLARDNAVAALRPHHFFEALGGLTLYVDAEGEQEGEFEGVYVLDQRQESRELVVLARQGQIRAIPDALALEFLLQDGEIAHAERDRPRDQRLTFDEYRFRVDIGAAVDRRTRFIQDFSTMTRAEIREYLESHPDLSRRDRSRLGIAVARKVALPFSCLVFALLGVTLGSVRRSSALAWAGVVATLSVAGYYIVFRLGDHLGEQAGFDPVLAAWLPNALFLVLVCGLFLWRGRR